MRVVPAEAKRLGLSWVALLWQLLSLAGPTPVLLGGPGVSPQPEITLQSVPGPPGGPAPCHPSGPNSSSCFLPRQAQPALHP